MANEGLEARLSALEAKTSDLSGVIAELLGHQQAIIAGLVAGFSNDSSKRRTAHFDALLETALVDNLNRPINESTLAANEQARRITGDFIRAALEGESSGGK